MLVSFIGCPCSGKTTSAAIVFSKLKDAGLPTEFIPEQARMHIAEKRYVLGLKPEHKLILTDVDQTEIMNRQQRVEDCMTAACGKESIIITDSSPFSTLLYYSPEYEHRDESIRLLKQKMHPRILFHSLPLHYPNSIDPNRVHTETQAQDIASKIDPLLKELGLTAITLEGDSQARSQAVFYEVLNAFMTEGRC